jgi:DNA-binding transcriptional LysR family regulator
VLADLGIALLPLPLVADDLALGTLKTVLSQYEVNGGALHISIVYSGRNYLATRTRNFIDFTVERFRNAAGSQPNPAAALRAVA